MTPNVKSCGKCRTKYRTADRSGQKAFDTHSKSADGLQPFCRACDWDCKNQPHRGYARLKSEGRGILVEINESQYRDVIAGNECHWCRGQLFLWSGYWVDRLDNDRNYEIGNVVPCCRWCNHYKNDLPQELWIAMIEALLHKHGTGPRERKVFRWDQYDPRKFKSTRPDLSRLIVRDADYGQGVFAIAGVR